MKGSGLLTDPLSAYFFYEDLLSIKDAHIKGVDIAVSREQNENMFRMEGIHCDYCCNETKGKPIIVDVGGKTYYACCPNCERDLKKRRELMPNVEG